MVGACVLEYTKKTQPRNSNVRCYVRTNFEVLGFELLGRAVLCFAVEADLLDAVAE